MKIKAMRVYGFSILGIFFAFYFFIFPFVLLINDLHDPGLRNGQTPRFAYRWHRNLSEEFASWANERVIAKKALNLSTENVSGTEWPMFSAVAFLWATEALQQNWVRSGTDRIVKELRSGTDRVKKEVRPDEAGNSLNKNNSNAFTEKKETMPKEYAKAAIEAAAELIADPNNAAWVKDHWGENYLHQENVFYRMLLISGLTSYQKLMGDKKYQSLLLDQVNTLSDELEASPYGLLDDYPGECYPVDVLSAIAAIQRADKVLGTEHSEFVGRAIRAFEGGALDVETGLPAYLANPNTGQGLSPARGVGISYMLIWASELWPDSAREWYKKYKNRFWVEGEIISGFREYSKEHSHSDWFFDVDAGPVVSGYGAGASGFGIGAARASNQFEQAYPLATEALVATWPLPNGTLLIPRMLSNSTDAPYMGEAALLFSMTRDPVMGVTATKNVSHLPVFVYLMLAFYLLLGMTMLSSATISIWRYHKK